MELAHPATHPLLMRVDGPTDRYSLASDETARPTPSMGRGRTRKVAILLPRYEIP
jgi:hypothetical protein